MGRTQIYGKGGFSRTVVCGCGWSYKGDPSRMIKIITLHSRRCDSMNPDSYKNLPTSFEVAANDNVQNTVKDTKFKAVQFLNDMPVRVDMPKQNITKQIQAI